MWKTIRTLLLGRAASLERQVEQANASLIIEQKIREAETGHETAKRGLAALIARSKSERRALDVIEKRIGDLAERTEAAVKAGKEALAYDAAKLLADLENERAVRCKTLDSADEKASRIRLAIEKTQRQLVDLRQGLITAKSIEAERAAVSRVKGDLSANSALAEGEAVLKRLIDGADPIEEIEALDEINAGLAGDDIVDRLAEAGFGDAQKLRPEDILARFNSGVAPTRQPSV